MKDNFLKSSSLLFASMMVANFFGYLFQITMGRMLGVQIFGEMNALFSILIIFGVMYESISNVLAKDVSHYHALDLYKRANSLIIKSYKTLLISGAVVLLAGLVFSKYISECLKIDSALPVILLFISVFVFIIIPINTGILQGLQKFGMLSFVSAGTAILKYVFCVIFVIAGTQLYGVMVGTILSALVVGWISYMPIKKYLATGHDTGRQQVESPSAIFPILIANISFALLAQSDMVLVKYFFTPHEAGIYSSAAIIGKTVMYLPGAIVISLFPMVASNKARDKGTLHLLLKALGITVLLSGSGAVLLYLFPEFIVSAFFGSGFAPAVHIVGLFAIAMMPLAVITIIMNYNMAKGGKYFSYVMLSCSLLQIGGIIYFHADITNVLKVILCTGLSCMAMLFFLLAAEYYFKIAKSQELRVQS